MLDFNLRETEPCPSNAQADKKIAVLKIVRTLTGLGIKEAKDSLKLFLKKNSLEIKDLLNKVRNASFASKGFTDWITYILMLTFDAKSLEKFKKEFPIDIFRFDEDKKIYDQFLSVN